MTNNNNKVKLAVVGGAIFGALAYIGFTVSSEKESQFVTAQKVTTPNHETKPEMLLDAQSELQVDSEPEMLTLAAEQSLLQQTAPEVEEDSSDEPDYIMQVTIDSYADDFNVSKTQAKQRLQRQDSLTQTMQEIVTIEGDNKVAAWGIDHGGEYKGWVQLVGDAAIDPDSQLILAENSDIEIRVGAKHTYKELVNSLTTLDATLRQSIDENVLPAEILDAVVYTDLDMEENRLVVAMNKEWQPSTWLTKEEMADSAQQYFNNQYDMPVIVTFDAAPVSSGITLTGGSGLRTCTAGFPVRELNDGGLGLLTAGHCSNDQRAPEYSFTTVYHAFLEKWDGMVDVQFHYAATGMTVSKYTHIHHGGYPSAATRIMDKTKPKHEMPGSYVCHSGMWTNYSCGNITSVNYNYYNEIGNWNYQFIKVEGPSLKGCKGDSGGPVFLNTTAFGIFSAVGLFPDDDGIETCGTALVEYGIFGDIRSALYEMNVELYY